MEAGEGRSTKFALKKGIWTFLISTRVQESNCISHPSSSTVATFSVLREIEHHLILNQSLTQLSTHAVKLSVYFGNSTNATRHCLIWGWRRADSEGVGRRRGKSQREALSHQHQAFKSYSHGRRAMAGRTICGNSGASYSLWCPPRLLKEAETRSHWKPKGCSRSKWLPTF